MSEFDYTTTERLRSPHEADTSVAWLVRDIFWALQEQVVRKQTVPLSPRYAFPTPRGAKVLEESVILEATEPGVARFPAVTFNGRQEVPKVLSMGVVRSRFSLASHTLVAPRTPWAHRIVSVETEGTGLDANRLTSAAICTDGSGVLTYANRDGQLEVSDEGHVPEGYTMFEGHAVPINAVAAWLIAQTVDKQFATHLASKMRPFTELKPVYRRPY